MENRKLQVYKKLRQMSYREGKKPIFISFSKLEKFTKCKMAYRLQYIDKEKVEFVDNIYSSMGTLCHDLIEQSVTDNLTREETVHIFETKSKSILDRFDGEVLKGLPIVESMRHFFKESSLIEELKTKKVAFEVPVYYKLKHNKKGYDVWLVGFIDLLVEHEDGSYDVMDFKTSNKAGYAGKNLQKALVQLYSYAYMLEFMTRKKINNVGYHLLKYVDMTFVDKKGKNRKSSKVERRNIEEEFSTKGGSSDLEMKDTTLLFDYNKDTRLSYMGELVGIFNEIEETKYSDFTCDGRDKAFCERFCPFNKDSNLCKQDGEPSNYSDVMKDVISAMFIGSKSAEGLNVDILKGSGN